MSDSVSQSGTTVFLIITKADIGGAQIHCLEIIKALQARYQFVLLCGEEDFLTEAVRALQVEVLIIDSLVRPVSPKQDWKAIKTISSLITARKPKFVHAHSSKAGVIGRIAAWRAGVPSLFTAHGWAFTEGAPFKQRCLGLLSEWALGRLPAFTIAVSNYDYQLAKRYKVVNPKRFHLVQNGVTLVEPDGLRATDKAPNSVPVMINIGRLTLVKNQLFLLQCLAQLDQPYQAKIIGAGDQYDVLKDAINRFGLTHKVELLLNIDDVSASLQSADLFVLSSKYEGLPLSVLEAMSAKLPVLSTDVGGVSDAVIDGETGLLVPSGDQQAMVEKLRLLLNDASLRCSLGQRGYELYLQKFTAQRMVSEVEQIYGQIP